MKIKREEFKELLKECIVELISEGKLSGLNSTDNMRHQSFRKNKEEENDDDNSDHKTANKAALNRLDDAVRLTTYLIAGGNSEKAKLFEGIIADTSRTTLQKQLAAEHSAPGQILGGNALPEEIALDKAQIDLFDGKDRWADVAFGNKRQQK